MTHDELRDLAGAYAIGAVTDEERRAIDARIWPGARRASPKSRRIPASWRHWRVTCRRNSHRRRCGAACWRRCRHRYRWTCPQRRSRVAYPPRPASGSPPRLSSASRSGSMPPRCVGGSRRWRTRVSGCARTGRRRRRRRRALAVARDRVAAHGRRARVGRRGKNRPRGPAGGQRSACACAVEPQPGPGLCRRWSTGARGSQGLPTVDGDGFRTNQRGNPGGRWSRTVHARDAHRPQRTGASRAGRHTGTGRGRRVADRCQVPAGCAVKEQA